MKPADKSPNMILFVPLSQTTCSMCDIYSVLLGSSSVYDRVGIVPIPPKNVSVGLPVERTILASSQGKRYKRSLRPHSQLPIDLLVNDSTVCLMYVRPIYMTSNQLSTVNRLIKPGLIGISRPTQDSRQLVAYTA
ncbi:hypothetical protein IV203_033580 [Nitzschia inconspicua]|uniref:Uncharacterized protein n=1 Tax=Nitzschia inconspicua TaxID=303405 RepID=A0A9K3M683_9STRA|nr:hypothetical protein IV203_033580 [Nitzschia inconspicua]